MPDKEIIQAVLDAVGVSRCKEERKHHDHDDVDCVAPDRVLYFIFCNCVTINNGACEDWEFCDNKCRPD